MFSKAQATMFSKAQARKAPVGILFLAHFINDMYANFLPQLVAVMVAGKGLTVSMGTLLVSAFTVTSSLAQPVFGYLVDQKGQRWLISVGTLWMSILLGTTGYISNYTILLAVSALAGMGTAAFHPQAAAMVGHAGGSRKGFVLASFIAMGNIGLAVSPLLLLPLFHSYGTGYTWLAVIPGILVTLLLYRFAPAAQEQPDNAPGLTQVIQELKKASIELGKLMVIVAFRSLVHTGLMTMLPLYFLAEKYSPETTGYLMFATLAAGAVGGIIGGYISDRYGRRSLIVISLVLSSVFFYGFLYTQGALSIILLGIGGMMLLSSFSVTVVAAQEVIPQNKALASGLSLGFAIGIGGLAVSLIGKYADIFGVSSAIHLIFVFPLVAGVLGLLLKKD